MDNTLITINLVVLNGEKYVRQCLDSVKKQTYPHDRIELNVLDNGSTDATIKIIKDWLLTIDHRLWSKFVLLEGKTNLGMWPGHEELLKHSSGEYILSVSVDVMIDKNFVERAVAICEADPGVGAVQAKIYQYNLRDLQ